MFAKFIVGLCLASMPLLALAQSKVPEEQDRLKAEIFRLTAANDFVGVERLVATNMSSQARFADGLWKGSFLYMYFTNAATELFTDDKSWKSALDHVEALAKGRPQAWMMYEELLSARAWQARGSGNASTVKPEAWPIFKRYLTRARDVLESHKGALSTNPAWYSTRLTLATELGEGEKASASLFDEAVSKHPAYHAIYFGRMRSLSPNWGGSRAQMLNLLDRVANLGEATRREAMYARLVWYADDTGYALTHDKAIDAAALNRSAEVLVDSFPDQRNVQKMFFMACERSDKALTSKMLQKVVPPALPDLWGRNLPLFDTCRDWATGKVPVFIMRVHDGDKVEDKLIK